MVKITNGINVLEVTSGAYAGIYKDQGYKPVTVEKSKKQAEPEKQPEAPVDEFAELEEKPISQWNKNEVKAYAEAKGIDLTGTKNVNEAKEIIKAAMSGSDE